MFNIKKYPNILQKSIKLTCKDCNKSFEQNIATEFNIADYPELHDALYDPDFFGCKCPKCKKESKLLYPFMYLDPKRKIGLFVTTPNDNITKLKYQILDDPNHPILNLRKSYYTTRLVACQKDFIEKREILEIGLDDRATELMKYYVKNNELKDEKYKSTKNTALTYYIDKNGNQFINTYIDTNPFEQITINIDAYEALRIKLIKKYGERNYDENILIDESWAKNNENIINELFGKKQSN